MAFIHQAWRDVGHDLQNAKWNWVLLVKLLIPFFILCWVFVLVATPIAIMVELARRAWTVACTPDDQFNLIPESFSYWSRTGFFQITLPFGNLTFDNAKLIDVIWDVVVGRGGQVLIALCSWHVFSLYVTTSMEITPITYHSYRVVFLETGPSCISTLLLARDFLWRKGLHSKIAMFFMILTMVFALCFPTFASAMTGYTSTVKSYVLENSTGHLISFDKFVRVLYVIHNGDRIGKTNPYFVFDLGRRLSENEPIISSSQIELHCTNMRRMTDLPDGISVDSNTTIAWRNLDACDIQYYTSKYVKQYGFYGGLNEASTFAGLRLEPPTLNITAEYFYEPALFGSAESFEMQDQNKTVWMWANDTYTYHDLSQKARCQSSGTTYQWGFSFMLLFWMVLILILWTFGIITMWWHAQVTIQKRGQYFVAGTHKAVIELAAAISKEFDLDILDCKLMSEKQVQERIAAIKGGCISYTSPLLVEKELPDTSLRKWLLQNTWWFLATCALAITTSLIWYLDILFCFWMIGPTLGMIIALSIGTTWKSKSIFILTCTSLSSVPVVYVAMVLYQKQCLKPFGGLGQLFNVIWVRDSSYCA